MKVMVGLAHIPLASITKHKYLTAVLRESQLSQDIPEQRRNFGKEEEPEEQSF